MSATDRRGVRLDRDGVPLDGQDWTDHDWRDLWNGIQTIRARIAARHRAEIKRLKAEQVSAPDSEA